LFSGRGIALFLAASKKNRSRRSPLAVRSRSSLWGRASPKPRFAPRGPLQVPRIQRRRPWRGEGEGRLLPTDPSALSLPPARFADVIAQIILAELSWPTGAPPIVSTPQNFRSCNQHANRVSRQGSAGQPRDAVAEFRLPTVRPHPSPCRAETAPASTGTRLRVLDASKTLLPEQCAGQRISLHIHSLVLARPPGLMDSTLPSLPGSGQHVTDPLRLPPGTDFVVDRQQNRRFDVLPHLVHPCVEGPISFRSRCSQLPRPRYLPSR